jgi:hypothetical protein
LISTHVFLNGSLDDSSHMPKLTQTAIRLDMPALFWPTFLLLLDYYRLNSFSYILGIVVELNQTLERVACCVTASAIQSKPVK